MSEKDRTLTDNDRLDWLEHCVIQQTHAAQKVTSSDPASGDEFLVKNRAVEKARADIVAEIDRLRRENADHEQRHAENSSEIHELRVACEARADERDAEMERNAELVKALERSLIGLKEWQREQERYHPESVDGWGLIEEAETALTNAKSGKE